MLRGREAVRADRRLGTDEKHIRAQSTISDRSKPKPSSLLSITVFSVRMCFSSVQKTRLARAARNDRVPTAANVGGQVEQQRSFSDKNQPQTAVAFIHNRVFRADALFIRTENTVGARCAQVWCLCATVPKTPNLVGDVGKHGAAHV
jgi:hypothetical protein